MIGNTIPRERHLRVSDRRAATFHPAGTFG
jgi:hypothetical protein